MITQYVLICQSLKFECLQVKMKGSLFNTSITPCTIVDLYWVMKSVKIGVIP